MKYFLFAIAFAMVSGCNKQVASGPDSSITYKETAYKALSIPEVQFFENDAKDFVLATYLAKGTVPDTKPFQYVVIKISDNSIIKKGVLPIGSVKWIDDYIIEIVAPPGMPEGNKTRADYTSQFNVKTGKPVSKLSVKD